MNARKHANHIWIWLFGFMVGAGALAGLCAPATAFAANVHKVSVVMKEFSFTPAKVELKVGETVER